VANLKSEAIGVPPDENPVAFIACMGEAALVEGLKLALQLREAGLQVLVSGGGRSLKAQLRQANAAGARYAVIIGEDEVRSGTVMLRNMESGGQQEVAWADVLNMIAV
jgi:histidyl-tRNA synthetase